MFDGLRSRADLQSALELSHVGDDDRRRSVALGLHLYRLAVLFVLSGLVQAEDLDSFLDDGRCDGRWCEALGNEVDCDLGAVGGGGVNVVSVEFDHF